MGRQGTFTVAGTSIPKRLSELIEFISLQEYKQEYLIPRKISHSKIVEEALLLLAYKKGILEDFLKQKEYPKEIIENIMTRHKEIYG